MTTSTKHLTGTKPNKTQAFLHLPNSHFPRPPFDSSHSASASFVASHGDRRHHGHLLLYHRAESQPLQPEPQQPESQQPESQQPEPQPPPMAARPLHLHLPAPASSSIPSSLAAAAAGASDSVHAVFASAPRAPCDHGVRERGGVVHEQGVVQARGGPRQAAAVLPERPAGARDIRGGPGAAALRRAAGRVHHQALLRAL
jgi:hypothetical protein